MTSEGMQTGGLELRVRGERAVLRHGGGEPGVPGEPGGDGQGAVETDPRRIAFAGTLADDLHEWARVSAAVLRTGNDQGAEVVSQRGRQLAARVAAALGRPVRYRDPVTEQEFVVAPARPADDANRARHHHHRHRIRLPMLGQRADATTPWATGLLVTFFVGVVVVVAMLALATTLSDALGGWVALAGAVVLTAGLGPSLWLGRRLLIVRWVVLGAAVGIGLSWVGVLFIVFA